jgi:lysophospholipase L1-like esterase
VVQWSRTVGVVATALLTASLTAGCTKAGPSTGAGSSKGAPAPSTYRQYVALGDSYTAGPYVPTTDAAQGCLRSDGNYPSLVARRLAVRRLTDVSCSGARTRDLHRPRPTFGDTVVPPQLDALRKGTDLVTVGIGGNDFALFGTLVGTCAGLGTTDPTGAPCTDQLDSQGVELGDRVARIERRVAAALREVRRRSPSARVLLVGYPRLVSPGRSCPGLLPFADGDLPTVQAAAAFLSRSMARAARAAGVEYVDMHQASRDHDICARDPWVNGQFTNFELALAYHPLPAGMRAVADRVVEQLS